MEGKEEKSYTKRYSKTYSINVTKSEPQVIDSKLTFYVHDLNPSPKKSTSDNKIIMRTKNILKSENEELDDKITNAIKNNLNFDSIMRDLGLENRLKKDKKNEKK